MTHLLLDLDTKDHVFDKVSVVPGCDLSEVVIFYGAFGAWGHSITHFFWGIKQMQTYRNFETFRVQ